MKDHPRLTPRDLSDIAHALHGYPNGAIKALARRLDVNADLLKAWCDGTAEIPDHLLGSLTKAIGAATPPVTTCGSPKSNGRTRRRLHMT